MFTGEQVVYKLVVTLKDGKEFNQYTARSPFHEYSVGDAFFGSYQGENGDVRSFEVVDTSVIVTEVIKSVKQMSHNNEIFIEIRTYIKLNV